MSDYETIQRRRNIIVGLFVIVAICALVWLVFKFGDLPGTVSKMRSFDVFVQFPAATGVQSDTPVRFCGYQIGRVTAVKPPKVLKDLNTGKFYHQTLVVISIDKKCEDIPEDVEAKLMTRGLGSSYIELKLRRFDVNEPIGPYLARGSKLQGSTGMTSEFFPEESQEKLDALITSLMALINNTNDIIGDPNSKENLKTTLANLSEASQQAVQTMQQAKQTIQQAEQTVEELRKFAATGTKTFQNADAKADRVVAALVTTSEELSGASAELRLILQKVNTGQGSVAKLLNDGRLYESMLESTEEMQMLLEELKTFIAESRDKGLPLKLK